MRTHIQTKFTAVLLKAFDSKLVACLQLRGGGLATGRVVAVKDGIVTLTVRGPYTAYVDMEEIAGITVQGSDANE